MKTANEQAKKRKRKQPASPPVASSTRMPTGGENEDNGTPTVKEKPGPKPKQKCVPGSIKGIGGRPRYPLVSIVNNAS